MKVILVNGSPHEHGCTYTALREAEKALNADGIDTEIFGWARNPFRVVLHAEHAENSESALWRTR